VTYQFIYLDYIDKATGKTLVVTPGSAYTIAVASGRNPGTPAIPNDGRWNAQSVFQSMEVLGQDAPVKTPKAPGGSGTAGTQTETEPGKTGEGKGA
jgi:hypothetical protein